MVLYSKMNPYEILCFVMLWNYWTLFIALRQNICNDDNCIWQFSTFFSSISVWKVEKWICRYFCICLRSICCITHAFMAMHWWRRVCSYRFPFLNWCNCSFKFPFLERTGPLKSNQTSCLYAVNSAILIYIWFVCAA